MQTISIILLPDSKEKFVVEAIETALNQSFQNYEILVPANVFIKEVYQNIKALNSSKIKLIQTQGSLSYSEKLKELINSANSDYITFLHPDDLLKKEALANKSSFVQDHSLYDAIFNFVEQETLNEKCSYALRKVVSTRTPHEILNFLFYNPNNIYRSGTVIKKSTLANLDLFDNFDSEQIVRAINIYLTLNSNIHIINEPLVKAGVLIPPQETDKKPVYYVEFAKTLELYEKISSEELFLNIFGEADRFKGLIKDNLVSFFVALMAVETENDEHRFFGMNRLCEIYKDSALVQEIQQKTRFTHKNFIDLFAKQRIIRNDNVDKEIQNIPYNPVICQKIKEFTEENQHKKICFYGAGMLARIITEHFDLSDLNILGFIDRDTNKRGQKLNGYTIYSIDDIQDLNPDLMVLTVLENKYLYTLLNELKLEKSLKFDIIYDLFTEDCVYIKEKNGLIQKQLDLIEKLYDDVKKEKDNCQNWVNNILGESNNLLNTVFEKAFGNNNEKLIFQKYDNPMVSIIIPVYNNFRHTYTCLYSILKNTKNISYEVIIADDNSNDVTTTLDNYIDGVIHIKNKNNLGFLRNCKNAASQANGKYLLFLNNDTFVADNWLEPLVNLMENDETIGLSGSKLVYPDGTLQEAGGIIWNDATGANYGKFQDPNFSEFNYVKDVDYISGASIITRKSLWDKTGGFDESFSPCYYEDTDYAFTVRSMGYRVVCQPKSVVIHFEGKSHGTDINSGFKSYQAINKDKFYEKWKSVLNKDHFAPGQNFFLARDRGHKKKNILVIDYKIPSYDKDAGSRATYNHLKLFVKMGLNVKYIGNDFIEKEPYTTELMQMGIEVLSGKYYKYYWEKWMQQNMKHFEHVYINRPDVTIKYIDIIKKHSDAKIIYHGHDLHHIREYLRYQIEKDEEILKRVDYFKSLELEVFNKSDVIVSLNDAETQVIKGLTKNKPVYTIPIFCYDKFKQDIKPFEERNSLLFIGGFLHKPNVDGVQWFVENIFDKVKQNIPDIKLYIAGSNATEYIKKLNSDDIIVKGYVSDEELNQLYNDVKMVVIPLRYGAGVKGKTIEAIYNLTPIVSTSIGIEGCPEITTIINPKDTAENFADEIIDLYNNNQKLEQISRSYENYIKTYFSTDYGIKAFEKAFGLDINLTVLPS